jgi:hypothetical protein
MLHRAGDKPSSPLVPRSCWRPGMREKLWLQHLRPFRSMCVDRVLPVWVQMHHDEQSGASPRPRCCGGGVRYGREHWEEVHDWLEAGFEDIPQSSTILILACVQSPFRVVAHSKPGTAPPRLARTSHVARLLTRIGTSCPLGPQWPGEQGRFVSSTGPCQSPQSYPRFLSENFHGIVLWPVWVCFSLRRRGKHKLCCTPSSQTWDAPSRD